MSLVRKQYEPGWVSFKALPDKDGQTGRFEAVVSVFGNVDLQGDRVVKGAFKKSIDQWRKTGDPIPIIWSHEWGDPFAHVGAADPATAEETDVGLKLIGTFDVDKPFAAQVYDLVKDRRVREWSFAYDVIKERKSADDGANELLILDLIEAGPTLKGANPNTFTIGVKSALESAAKAGRVLSAKNEDSLRTAHNLIGEVLAGLPETEDSETKQNITINVTGSATMSEKEIAEQVRDQLTSVTVRNEKDRKERELDKRNAEMDRRFEWVKEAKSVYTQLEGSYEAQQQEVWYAVREWGYNAIADAWWVGLAATYPDHVILEVEPYDGPVRYVKVDYTRGADGIEFGEPTNVQLNVSISEKKDETEAWLKAELAAWLTAEAAYKAEQEKPEWQKANDRLKELMRGHPETQLQNGGIVTGPVAVVVGEDGPETVIPLKDIDEGKNKSDKSIEDYKRELGMLTADLL